MRKAAYWIEHLQLQPHPEGGYYKETYRSSEQIASKGLPARFNGNRSASTAIYFLLTHEDRSLFHRIKSDEVWHFHYGDPLDIYVLSQRGVVKYTLGSNPEHGEAMQIVVPANHWFGAKVHRGGAYTLMSCTVAPGFDFQDFELADRGQLLLEFPADGDIIEELTSP